MKFALPAVLLALTLGASAQSFPFVGGQCVNYPAPHRSCDSDVAGMSLHFDVKPDVVPGPFVGMVTVTTIAGYTNYVWSGTTDGLTFTGTLANGGSLTVTTKSERTAGRYAHTRWVVTTGTLTLPVTVSQQNKWDAPKFGVTGEKAHWDLMDDGGAPFPNCSPQCCGKKLGDPNICDPTRKAFQSYGM